MAQKSISRIDARFRIVLMLGLIASVSSAARFGLHLDAPAQWPQLGVKVDDVR